MAEDRPRFHGNDIRLVKRSLRKKFREIRMRLAPQEKAVWDQRITANLLRSPRYRNAKRVLLLFPNPLRWTPILSFAPHCAKKSRCCCPGAWMIAGTWLFMPFKAGRIWCLGFTVCWNRDRSAAPVLRPFTPPISAWCPVFPLTPRGTVWDLERGIMTGSSPGFPG